MTTDIYTVAGVTGYIRSLFDSDPPLQDIWVRGEVSNMRAAASGHWYFTLKDEDAQLKCVMFRSAAQRQAIEPREGDAITVHGRVSVYDARGEYQLYADQIQAVGSVGDLYLQFEQVKAKLGAEGLFDQQRKRDIPTFPLRIGVVTSADAAAFRDVLNVLTRRFPLAEVILSPTLVQGREAPLLIVNAIQRITQHSAADVLILCRGGGSIEDLWAFNDEHVARALAASPIPTICGVGHETDFTIVDFVADRRAPTPSAAAEIAVPNLVDLQYDLQEADAALDRVMRQRVSDTRADIADMLRTLVASSPQKYIEQMRQRVDDLSERSAKQQRYHLNLLQERLQSRINALHKANPEAILQRGYAIVTHSEDGKPILHENDVKPGEAISIRLKEGDLKARVEDKESHGNYKRTLF
ncbi:MAG: exodeoxyribonuclease VII large subunit [Anaerolineae bacterium]|nr:exodeoxyribonuclease VII large subunit [Anaerolineae bacterium]